MEKENLTLKTAGGMFNYRVGAIIIHDNCVLMCKNQGSSYYYTIGGRVGFGESAHEAVLREVSEEIQIPLEIERLAYVNEVFFRMEEDTENNLFHEICFFFLMKPDARLGEMKLENFNEDYGKVTLHWLPLVELKTPHLFPKFFKDELEVIENNVKYFVTRDDITFQP